MIFLHRPLLKALLYLFMKLPMHYDCVLSIISLFCTFFDLGSSFMQRGKMDGRNFILSCFKLFTEVNL